MDDQTRGSVRKRTAFSLFTRQKPAPHNSTIISAPVALSPTTGAAAGIPGFVPQPSTSSKVASDVVDAAAAEPSTAAKPLSKIAQVKAERASAWAAHYAAPSTSAPRVQPALEREQTQMASISGHQVGRESLLLPASFSTGSGLTASSSNQCISASTSRNTVLPALHPIINTSASGRDIRIGGIVSPSASLGQQGMPSLASAIKLGNSRIPASDSIPVNPIAAKGPASPPIIRSSLPDKSSTLPRSMSGSSVFTIHRQPTRKVSNDVPAGPNESLSRRISRRLSIDGFRPKFGGGSHKRRSVMDVSKGVAEFGSMLPNPKVVEPAAVAVAPAPAPAVRPPDAMPGKEKMMLPGFRSWRTRFKHNSIASSAEGSTEKLPESRPGSRAKRDSWVDVGSVRSRMSRMRMEASVPDELGRTTQPDERSRPIGSTGMKARIVTGSSEHENVYRRSYIEPSMTAEDIDAKVERLIGKYDTTIKSSNTAQPNDKPPKLEYKLASQSTTSLNVPTLNTVIPSSRFSPANDDMSVLDPLQSRRASPEPPLPPLPTSMLVALNGDGTGGHAGLPSSRSLNALDSFSHISNTLDCASPALGADEKASVARKRSMVALGSSSMVTANVKQHAHVRSQDSPNTASGTAEPARTSAQVKSRPVSTMTTFEIEADVSIVTATRHERLPFARSYSGSIADHLSILSASSSGLEVSGMIDSRASIASIAAPPVAHEEDPKADGDGRVGFSRDGSTMTFHTAPSANSVTGLPSSSLHRAALSTGNYHDSSKGRTTPPASPPAPSRHGIEPSPSLIAKMEKQQGEGWWSVSRKSRLNVVPQEFGSPTRAKARSAKAAEVFATSSKVDSPRSEVAKKRSSKTVSFPASATAKSIKEAESPRRLLGKAQVSKPSPRKTKAAGLTRPLGASGEQGAKSNTTEMMPAATSQASIALSLICPSPPPQSTSAGTHDPAIHHAAVPLTLAPAVDLASAEASIPDQLRTMRDKHERELDAILDSLYQAEVERDRANARCYRMYREWQTALRRAEAAEADQCDGADRCEKSHYAAMCREKWMVELKEKSAYILEMDDANEEREKVLGENVKKVKVLESQNVAMRIIMAGCSRCSAMAEKKIKTTSRFIDPAKASPATDNPDNRPAKTHKHTSQATGAADVHMAASPALPSAPSNDMISKSTPLPDIRLADPPEYRERADVQHPRTHVQAQDAEREQKGLGPISGDMTRTNTGSGSETVWDPEVPAKTALKGLPASDLPVKVVGRDLRRLGKGEMRI